MKSINKNLVRLCHTYWAEITRVLEQTERRWRANIYRRNKFGIWYGRTSERWRKVIKLWAQMTCWWFYVSVRQLSVVFCLRRIVVKQGVVMHECCNNTRWDFVIMVLVDCKSEENVWGYCLVFCITVVVDTAELDVHWPYFLIKKTDCTFISVIICTFFVFLHI